MIIDLFGYPEDESELEILSDFKDKEILKKISANSEKSFEERFTEFGPDVLDLLRKMLAFDPKKRITVEEALNHPYLAALHCPEDEPSTEHVSPFDFDFEIYDLKREDYKELLYEEVMLYHSDELCKQYMDNKAEFPNGILCQKYGGSDGGRSKKASL